MSLSCIRHAYCITSLHFMKKNVNEKTNHVLKDSMKKNVNDFRLCNKNQALFYTKVVVYVMLLLVCDLMFFP